MGTGYNFSANISYSISPYLAARFLLIYGTASDSDKGTLNAARNYSYSSRIIQPAIQLLYTFYKKDSRGYSGNGLLMKWTRWRADILGGPGILFYNATPGGSMTGDDMTAPKGSATVITLGTSIQYGLSSAFSLRAELIPEFIFSDSIDGYASLYSRSNDFMYILSFSIIYHFPEKHKNRSSYCPYQ